MGMLQKIILILLGIITLVVIVSFFGIFPVIFFALSLVFFYQGVLMGFRYYMLIASIAFAMLFLLSIFVDFGF